MSRISQALLITSLFLVPILTPCRLGAQEKKDQPSSPVFKNYKPKDTLDPLPQSDALRQIWLAFVTAQDAKNGDPLAQHELGLRYLFGKGLDPDTNKAAYWIRKAADQELMPARFNIAILEYNGWGTPWNPFAAFEDFLISANHDMPEAQAAVAEIYLENLVVPRDFDKARSWLKKAADAEYKPAKEALEKLQKELHRDSVESAAAASAPDIVKHRTPVSVVQDAGDDTTGRTSEWTGLTSALRGATPELKKALGMNTLLEKSSEMDSLSFQDVVRAADNGSPEALAVLGRCYERGIKVAKDPVQATVQYVRAIRMGSPRAPGLLWSMIQKDGYTRELKDRAEKGEPDAQFAWAALVGLGFTGALAQGNAYLTDAQALQMLKKSAAAQNQNAIIELGLCYYTGRWVPQNKIRARELWNEVERLGSREAKVRLAVTDIEEKGKQAPALGADIAELDSAITDGSVLAEVALGYCYEVGIGVPQKSSEAARLYRSGASRGSPDAYRALRRMLDRIRPAEDEYRMEE